MSIRRIFQGMAAGAPRMGVNLHHTLMDQYSENGGPFEFRGMTVCSGWRIEPLAMPIRVRVQIVKQNDAFDQTIELGSGFSALITDTSTGDSAYRLGFNVRKVVSDGGAIEVVVDPTKPDPKSYKGRPPLFNIFPGWKRGGGLEFGMGNSGVIALSFGPGMVSLGMSCGAMPNDADPTFVDLVLEVSYGEAGR